MAPTNVEAAQLFLRRQDVTEKRLLRLVKSSDLKKVGLQEGIRMCEEEIVAVEKSKAVDKIDQLERLVRIEGALADDLEQLQLHFVDLQKQLHELRMSSLDAQSALQYHEAQSSPSSLTTAEEDNEMRPDPVKAEALALHIAKQVQDAAETPLPGVEAMSTAKDAEMALLAEHAGTTVPMVATTLPQCSYSHICSYIEATYRAY